MNASTIEPITVPQNPHHYQLRQWRYHATAQYVTNTAKGCEVVPTRPSREIKEEKKLVLVTIGDAGGGINRQIAPSKRKHRLTRELGKRISNAIQLTVLIEGFIFDGR